MRVVLWTLGALERACVCGHVTMHSLHLSSCRTSASKLLRDRVPLLLECVCAVSLCTCACHCIHFQMPITAFTQQQCMCEGRSARKKCQKKGGPCPYARGAFRQALYSSPNFSNPWPTERKNHSRKKRPPSPFELSCYSHATICNRAGG
jgi:hypothetical protein